VVKNRPGASGALSARATADAPQDDMSLHYRAQALADK
jgi:tripartite-type tricarboxylate transporter receptor subunit TctC